MYTGALGYILDLFHDPGHQPDLDASHILGGTQGFGRKTMVGTLWHHWSSKLGSRAHVNAKFGCQDGVQVDMGANNGGCNPRCHCEFRCKSYHNLLKFTKNKVL